MGYPVKEQHRQGKLCLPELPCLHGTFSQGNLDLGSLSRYETQESLARGISGVHVMDTHPHTHHKYRTDASQDPGGQEGGKPLCGWFPPMKGIALNVGGSARMKMSSLGFGSQDGPGQEN